MSALGVLVAAAAGAARTQTSGTPTIGFLSTRSQAEAKELTDAFLAGLHAEGYYQDQNVAIEFRWANFSYESLPSLASDLIDRHVSVIAAVGGIHSGLAASKLTVDTPIVFVSAGDPVAFGLVSSLNRPDRNVTGISMITVALASKRLEILHEIIPSPAKLAMLVNPSSPYLESERNQVMASAEKLHRQLHIFGATNSNEIEVAFASISHSQMGALLVSGDPFFDGERELLIKLAAQRSLPTIYQWREFAEMGGLISYGTSILDAYRQSGEYVGKILKGAKPSDLPVIQPTRIETVLNLRTAKALGLVLPNAVLAGADEVIE